MILLQQASGEDDLLLAPVGGEFLIPNTIQAFQ